MRGKCVWLQLGHACEARLGYPRARAAVGAEAVAAVPVEQRHEIGGHAGLGLRQQQPGLTQRHEPPGTGLGQLVLRLGVVEVRGEQRLAVLEAQQDRLVGVDVTPDRPAQQSRLGRLGDQHAVRAGPQDRGAGVLE